MKTFSGILVAAVGTLVVGWVALGGKTLNRLLQDEGTESFAVRLGTGGLLGCVAFLFLVGTIGILLICYGINVSRRGT